MNLFAIVYCSKHNLLHTHTGCESVDLSPMRCEIFFQNKKNEECKYEMPNLRKTK